jgi:hypothetical protein
MSSADILEPNKTYIFTYTAEAAQVKNNPSEADATANATAESLTPPPPPVLGFTATVVHIFERDPSYKTLCVKNFKYDNGEEIKSEIVTMSFSWIQSFKEIKETQVFSPSGAS